MHTQKRPVQYFSPEYLAHCKLLSPQQIIEFLDDFQKMLGNQNETRRDKS